MKNIYFLLSASLLIASCGPTHVVVQSDSYPTAPVEDVSYQSFYDQLSPYGSWINYPGYGYVWMPNAGPDFKPYSTNGNWIYTDAGWTWTSNYSWGWAPFHYGRWFFENGYGWMWIPGNEWAPAWVSWRGSGDYYGWAPVGPRISVDIALNSYNPPVNYWNFVPRQYMGNPGWHNYYVNESRNVTIINNTTIINNYSGTDRNRYAYAPGPDPNEVRRVSGNNFTQVQIRETNAPGERVSGTQYTVYHPRVNATPAARGDAAGRPSTPAPARYESFSNLHPSTQYPAYNQANNNLQTANSTRPAGQNQGFNQPNNNPQPANNSKPEVQHPGYNQGTNGSGTPALNQGYNEANNHPQPANNPRPVSQNPSANQPAAQPNPPADANLNDNRMNRFNPSQANDRPAQPHTMPDPSPVNHVQTSGHPAQNNALPQPSPANHVQTNGHPATNHNPNNGHPAQRTAAPQNKPAQKPVQKPDQKPDEKPKTRDANNN